MSKTHLGHTRYFVPAIDSKNKKNTAYYLHGGRKSHSTLTIRTELKFKKLVSKFAFMSDIVTTIKFARHFVESGLEDPCASRGPAREALREPTRTMMRPAGALGWGLLVSMGTPS